MKEVQGRKSQLLSIIEDYDEDFRGVTATQLNKDLPLDKSTISYHLNDLESRKLVTSVKVGRKKFLDTTEKGSELLEDQDITDPIKASCGNCGKDHSSFEDAKTCCTEDSTEKSTENNTTESTMNDFKLELQKAFSDARHPEHVEKDMRKILKIIQEEIEFSSEQWEEVFETLSTEIEFEEAGWLQ